MRDKWVYILHLIFSKLAIQSEVNHITLSYQGHHIKGKYYTVQISGHQKY